MKRKPLFKFSEILEANTTRENLAKKLDGNQRQVIGQLVVDRQARDKETMGDWLQDAETVQSIADLNAMAKVKPFGDNDSYNIQFPLLLSSIITTSSSIYSAVHSDKYVAMPRVREAADEEVKVARATRVRDYLQAVLVDYPDSSWMSDMSKIYIRFVLLGTVIKQVNFDPATVTFDNPFVPYTDIFIHNKSPSLEKAPAITIQHPMSQNDVMERINAGLFIEYDTVTQYNGSELDPQSTGADLPFDDGTRAAYPSNFFIYEQHAWFDLDADGYAEPYIAFVDRETHELLRLIPAINTQLSQLQMISETEVKPVKLMRTHHFADMHYLPSPKGDFWSLGIGKLIGALNAQTNEFMNNMANVATMATRQGGVLGFGGRRAAGAYDIDSTKYNTLPINADDLRKALVQFDIRDPSPVIKELTLLFIETAEKMGMMSAALSGDMPNREMSALTMLQILEQNMRNPRMIYQRVRAGIAKELNIVARTLLHNGDQAHYRMVVGEPEADLFADFDLSTLDLVLSSDDGTSSATETMMKYNVLKDFIVGMEQVTDPTIDKHHLIHTAATSLDIANPERIFLPPPEPQPDPQIELAREKLANEKEKDDKEHEREMIELETDARFKAAEAAKDLAVGASVMAQAETDSLEVAANAAALAQSTEPLTENEE